jgi:hypothetical protein
MLFAYAINNTKISVNQSQFVTHLYNVSSHAFIVLWWLTAIDKDISLNTFLFCAPCQDV